jgi:two-component system phosphate regulon sensor histidine kinase PhoR
LRVETGRVRTLSATRSRIPELIQGEDCYVTILHDVTREREIEQMKSDFISAVSHELRTPLTSIKGFATTLLRNPSMAPDKRGQFLRIIDEESERLMQLIESLLAMGSIEAGRLVLDLAPVNIEQIVATLDLSLARTMTAKHIKYERDIEKGLPPVIADGNRLHTIIGNLLENAIKFTPDRGHVTLRIRRDDDQVVITVRDTGVGIPREQLSRIFERFYQVQSGNQKASGAGLGLFLVKEMVRLHQGTIEVESEPGRGAAFTVRLPLAPAATQAHG